MTKQTIHTFIALLTTGLFMGGAHAALITNGSFEDNTNTGQFQATGSTAITGWTTTLSGVEYFQPGAGNAREGDWVIDLAYVTSSLSGGIAQSISTVNGEQFNLDFSLGTFAGLGRDGTAEVQLLIDDAVVGTYTITNLTANYVWEDHSYVHTATGSSTKIEFRNEENANFHFAFLDGVGTSAIPEPSSTALLVLGSALLLRQRSRRTR